MPTAEQLTAIAAIIAAITGLATAIGGYFTHRTVSSTAVTANDVQAKLETGNGKTVGQNSAAAAATATALAESEKPPTGA